MLFARSLVVTLATLGLALGFVSTALAQAQADGKSEPTELTMETKDGVVLKATFFPGQRDKRSIPVILLHEFKKSRRDMEGLALYLQQSHGCAVIVPDLRGHGDSTLLREKDGGIKRLEADTLKPAQFQDMVLYDLETVKKHLVEENNAGRCNIDALSLVGVQMGGSVALLWGARDWSWPPLVTGKQGQDVKAIALIGPVSDFKGLRVSIVTTAREAGVRDYATNVSLYVAVGSGTKPEHAEAQRIFNMFNQGRKPPKEDSERTMFFDPMDTSLRMSALLTESSLKLPERLGAFIEFRAEATSSAWQLRANPLGP